MTGIKNNTNFPWTQNDDKTFAVEEEDPSSLKSDTSESSDSSSNDSKSETNKS